MKQHNITTLEKHYHHWITLRDGQYLRGLNIHEREDMLRVLREEFWPGYTYDEWCGSCVADMVKEVYSRYDKWKGEQPAPVIEPTPPYEAPLVVHATFPMNDKPVFKEPENKEWIKYGESDIIPKPPKKRKRK
jgi:hypothetical protein